MPHLQTRALPRRLLAHAGTSAAALFVAAPVLAGPLALSGDGSRFDNPDLARIGAGDCADCTARPSSEPNDWLEADWSVALRGAYVQTTGGSYFETSVVPTVTLGLTTLRGGLGATATAELTRSDLEDWRIGGVNAALAGSYQLDSDTTLIGSVDLSLSQASARSPGADPAIAVQPQIWSGEANLALARGLGPLVVTARGNVSRTLYGPTTLIDSSVTDNTDQSNWTAGIGLRVGYRLSPVLTPFIDASLGYQWYDAPSQTLLVRLDAMDLEARAGIAAQWTSVIEAEVSAGYGIRHFADPTLEASRTVLYGASVTARPDETLELRGSLSTSHGAPGPDSTATARLEYAATASLAYRVNPWLALRASAGWTHAELVGTNETEDGASLGVGADYLLTEHLNLAADYAYTQTTNTPGTSEDEHRVTLGVTVRR